MAHFYGTIQGARGKASRLGTPASGLEVTAASWQGAVRVTLRKGDDGHDYACAELRRWHGDGNAVLLYDGPVGGAGAFTSDLVTDANGAGYLVSNGNGRSVARSAEA